MSINSALLRWKSLYDEISINPEYNDSTIHGIKPLLLDSYNRVYISENINKEMGIYIEFDNNGSINNYSFPEIKGITLSVKEDVVIKRKTYLCVKKDNDCPEELFISLSISISEALINSGSDLSTIIKIDDILKEYSNMFTKKYESIGKEAEQGLFCELLFLEELIKNNDDEYVRYWTGPEKNKHDFVIENKAVEIKSTLNEEQLILHISNENQLDSYGLDELKLIAYVLEHNNSGESIMDVINRIINLIKKPDVYLQFISDLAMLKIDPKIYRSEYKFKVIHIKEFIIDESFPKISKSNISSKIFDVKYRINLSDIEQ